MYKVPSTIADMDSKVMVMILTDFLSNSENEQILSEDQMELK